MSSLLETLAEQLGGNTMGEISRQLGTDQHTAGNAIGAALSTIIGALSRNTSSTEGAAALHDALSRDHDGGLLDNLSNFLGHAEAGSGDAILGHVLGGRRSQVESGLSQTTGLEADSMGKLMTMLAPIVMSALARQRSQGNLDARSLSSFLGEQRETIERAPQTAGLIGELLDTDDGDVDISDLAKHGAGLLGQLFCQH